MAETERISRLARAYFGIVIFAGMGTALLAGVDVYTSGERPDWLGLAALTLLTGSFTVKVPGLIARLSVSDAFVFASVLAYNPAVATVIVTVDSVVATFWMQREFRSVFRSTFNLATAALSIWIAAHVFYVLADTVPGSPLTLSELLVPLFVLAALYFLINSWLVAIALGFEKHTSPVQIWWENFPWLSLNYFGGVSVAALLFSQTRRIDLTTISLMLPILTITYFAYRTSLGRLEDAKQHVIRVNELYLSTIEALATAVDAKDQITHGHIRRVQVYAVELAQRLGLRDELQMKAIEAAALLHDMGKLAIPEHILNKPGKLTAIEFEKMKRHADIGADLLSSIRFPYPVVPIVRHHHENWDGTGYPGKLAGADIPLGARILSVVDCFDALTSDRPYRPRMSTDEAFEILRSRRSNMYDPLVVDTFISAYSQMAPAAELAGQQARSLVSHAFGQKTLSPFADISNNAAQATILDECARALKYSHTSGEIMDVTAQYVGMLTPATVCAFYRYFADADTLTCMTSAGDENQVLPGLSIRNGERITGWAVAHETVIANSPATLDLGDMVDLFEPALQSALVAPLRRNGKLVGALSVYSKDKEPFIEDHRYALERIASALVEAMEVASASPDRTSPSESRSRVPAGSTKSLSRS